MRNYDESVEINQNLNWPYIPDHPYRILIICGSGSEKNYCIIELNKKSTTKCIYTSKIHSNQSINYLLMEEKK